MTALEGRASRSVRYGDLVGVADISMTVETGKIVALLGSNGAGKTTTLNAIAGVVQRRRAAASSGVARRFPGSPPTRSSARGWRCLRKAGGCSSRRPSSKI